MDDQVGLHFAAHSDLPVLPLFILDDDIINDLPEDDHRLTYIHEHLKKIHQAFVEQSGGIHVERGKVEDVWKKLLEQYNIVKVFTNQDFEAYGINRDKRIKTLVESTGATFETYTDHILSTPGMVEKEDQTPYLVFTPFSKKWKSVFQESWVYDYPIPDHVEWIEPNRPLRNLSDYGLSPSRMRLPEHSLDTNLIEKYSDRRDIPHIKGTTHVSTALRFGTISIRKLVRLAREHSETWLNELIWREFFIHTLFFHQYSSEESFKAKYRNMPWQNDEKEFELWKEGKTGFPIVDAGMRELNETGFMHNRIRMVVSSFLCKYLMVDWKWGERYFAEKLFDYELASNVGNWQWAAGTGVDAAPYFRLFNPFRQQERFDPNFKYIKKWIPEWGTDEYPKPMIDMKQRRLDCLEFYKAAPYHQ